MYEFRNFKDVLNMTQNMPMTQKTFTMFKLRHLSMERKIKDKPNTEKTVFVI